MPDCLSCPIAEALRMERDNAQAIVDALHPTLMRLRLRLWFEPFLKAKRRREVEANLRSATIKLARARMRVDLCANLLALVHRAGRDEWEAPEAENECGASYGAEMSEGHPDPTSSPEGP